MDIAIGVIWILSGLVLLAIAVFKWDWRKRSPFVRFMVKLMTEARVRSICGAFGVVFIVVGVLWMMGLLAGIANIG
jgi:hypothetical protein